MSIDRLSRSSPQQDAGFVLDAVSKGFEKVDDMLYADCSRACVGWCTLGSLAQGPSATCTT